MTREEAIQYWKPRYEHITKFLEETREEPSIREYAEAIDMAISALSAEDADGCLGCEYEGLSEFDEPCTDCKNNYLNKWNPKKTEPSEDIEGDIDFHCDLKHNRMTWFNNITESPNDVVETDDEVIEPNTTNHENVQNCGEQNHENVRNEDANDSDLIRRADAVKAVEEAITNHDSAIMRISNIPSISAEHGTCYNCEHWNAETKGCKRNPSVEAWNETDYCSYYSTESAPNSTQEVPLKYPSDLISRADAVDAMRKLLGKLGEKAEIELNCLTGYVPLSAERSTLVVPLKYPCDDCKWWNPQVNRCNKDAETKDIYTHSESVSAEPKRGEWKPIELNGYPYMTCDQCGLLADMVSKDGEFVMSMANADEAYARYCPNCGAKMGVSE